MNHSRIIVGSIALSTISVVQFWYLKALAEPTKAEWTKADSLFKQKDYDSALQAYTKIISKNPKNAEAYVKFGTTLATMKRYEDAITAYEYAIELDPAQKNVYKLLAEVYKKNNQPLKAKEVIQDSASLQQKNMLPDLEKRLAAVDRLKNKGSLNEALNEVDKIISENPNETSAWIVKSGIFFKMKKYGQALKSALQAHKLKPSSKTYHILGLIYEKQSKDQMAKDAYLSAIKLNGSNCSTYYALSRLFRKEGNLNQSSVMSEEGRKRDPRFKPLDFENSPTVSLESSRTKSIALTTPIPETALQYNNRGVELGSKGLWPEAIAHAQKAHELKPYNIYFRRNLSSANLRYAIQLEREGNKKDAIVRFREAIKADSSNKEAKQRLRKLENE